MRTLRWYEGALVFIVSYIVSSAVILPLIPFMSLKNVTAISVVVLIGISYFWVRRITGDAARYAGVEAVSPKILVLTAIASFAIMIPAMSVEAVVLERFKAPPEVLDALEDLIRAGSPLEFIYAILVAAVGASVSEEFVFRGILQNSLSAKVGAWKGLVLATIVFGLLHTLWRFPGAFMLGLFLGFIYQRTGSLIPGLVSHFIINASSVILFNVAERSTTGVIPAWMEEDRPAPHWLIGLSVVVLAVVLTALWRETAGEPYPLPHGEAGGDASPEGTFPRPEESEHDIA
jgi:membrane protease YdiL (CAAX protease family)